MGYNKDKYGLTTKQKAFADAYHGNATEAALRAGYSTKTAYSIGAELLKKPEIIEYISTRNEREQAPNIADRQERQAFWSAVMRGEIGEVIINNGKPLLDRNGNPKIKYDLGCRLRASELLGKSEGDFLERQEIEIDGGPLIGSIIVQGPSDE